MPKRLARVGGSMLFAWILLTCATWVVVTVVFAFAGSAVQAWDEWVLAWLYRHDDDALSALSHAVTDLGKPAAAVPLTTLAVLAFFFGLRRRRDAIFILASTIGAGSTYLVLLPIFARPRPDTVDVSGLGMPSGHAVATLSLALPVAIAAWRAWGGRGLAAAAPAVLIAIVVGVTRPYIQYHYVSDVIVAWAMTIAWVVALDRWLLPSRSFSSSSTRPSSSSPASPRRPRELSQAP